MQAWRFFYKTGVGLGDLLEKLGSLVGEPVEVSNDVAAELGEAEEGSNNEVSNNVEEKVGADVVEEKVGDPVEATGREKVGDPVGDGDTGISVGSSVVAITGDLVGGGGVLLRFAFLEVGI